MVWKFPIHKKQRLNPLSQRDHVKKGKNIQNPNPNSNPQGLEFNHNLINILTPTLVPRG